MTDTCVYCGRDLGGGPAVTAGNGGSACQLCWEQHHPPTRAETLEAIMGWTEGRLFIAAVIKQRLGSAFVMQLVDRFNHRQEELYVERLRLLLEARQKEKDND